MGIWNVFHSSTPLHKVRSLAVSKSFEAWVLGVALLFLASALDPGLCCCEPWCDCTRILGYVLVLRVAIASAVVAFLAPNWKLVLSFTMVPIAIAFFMLESVVYPYFNLPNDFAWGPGILETTAIFLFFGLFQALIGVLMSSLALTLCNKESVS